MMLTTLTITIPPWLLWIGGGLLAAAAGALGYRLWAGYQERRAIGRIFGWW